MATVEYDPPLFQAPEGNIYKQEVDEKDKEFIQAKAYLLQTSNVTGFNLYDHLANVLTRVLDERPLNAVDIIEEISKQEKRNKFTMKEDNIVDKPDKTSELELAKIQKRLFSRHPVEEDEEEEEFDEDDDDIEDDEDSPLPDIMQLCYYFEQAGVGLNREEMVRISLALKTLIAAHQFETVRFWGKIFGTEQNYIIAEVKFVPDADDEEDVEEEQEEYETKPAENEDDEHEEDADKPPQITYKPPPPVEKEAKGTGLNKMVYFVCNEPGKPWVRLPSVSPAHITVARKIKKFFTGRLDAPIVSYPPFEGNEANYLRAQIARISSGTQVSPTGYYKFDEDEEEPAEGEIRENIVADDDYEPRKVRELIEPDLEQWVHHSLYILPQGRAKWWNPQSAQEGDEGESEEHEKEEPEEIQPEVPLPLLTPLSEDADLNGMPAWTTRISSKLIPKHAIAVLHSCLWPGAHAFAVGKTFENIYIGWGHKYSPENFSPALPPPIQQEFRSGPEITEVNDPTVDEEREFNREEDEEDIKENEEEDSANSDDDEI